MSLNEYEDIKRQTSSLLKKNHITKITKTFSSIMDSLIPSAVAQDEEEEKEENIDTNDPRTATAVESHLV